MPDINVVVQETNPVEFYSLAEDSIIVNVTGGDAGVHSAAALAALNQTIVIRDSAQSLLDEFYTRYLGDFAADPALDNQGGALLPGALYFNNVALDLRVWRGSSWLALDVGSGDMLAINNLSDLDNIVTARANLGVEIGVDVQGYSAVLAATTASFLVADSVKLGTIEDDAKDDQTGAEIKVAYEAEADTNALTDVLLSKLGTLAVPTFAAGAPATTPASLGLLYVDTTAGTSYVSTGTASSADWKQATGLGGGDLLAANNLSDVGNAATAAQNLGLEIGVDVQAYDALLEAGATADQTGTEIKSAYEAEADTNAFTDALLSKLGSLDIVTSGAGVPGSTPSKLGLAYIDTTNSDVYMSTGTASSADWTNLSTGGAGAILGSFTATLTCGTSGTITLEPGSDTIITRRVGDEVRFYGELIIQSVTAPVGDVVFGPIPTCADLAEGGGVTYITITGTKLNPAHNGPLIGKIEEGATTMKLMQQRDGGLTSIDVLLFDEAELVINGSMITSD